MIWSAIAATNVLVLDEVSMMSGEFIEKIGSICCEVATGDN